MNYSELHISFQLTNGDQMAKMHQKSNNDRIISIF